MTKHSEKFLHWTMLLASLFIGFYSVKAIGTGVIILSIIGVLGMLVFDFLNFLTPMALLKYPLNIFYYLILIVASVYLTASGGIVAAMVGGFNTVFFAFLASKR